MNIRLLDREGTFTTSPLYYAYRTLKLFEKNKAKEASIFRVLTLLRNDSPEADAKQLFYGLIFLHMNGIMDFDNGIMKLKNEN